MRPTPAGMRHPPLRYGTAFSGHLRRKAMLGERSQATARLELSAGTMPRRRAIMDAIIGVRTPPFRPADRTMAARRVSDELPDSRIPRRVRFSRSFLRGLQKHGISPRLEFPPRAPHLISPRRKDLHTSPSGAVR